MKKLIILLAVCTMSVSVFSQDANTEKTQFDNTWIEVEYINNDWGNGLKAKGSYSLNDNLNVIGSWRDFKDVLALTAGLSYNKNLTHKKNWAILFHAEISHIQFEPSGEDNAVLLGSELRVQVSSPLELYSDLYYSTLKDGDLGLDIGARYSATESIQLIAGANFSDNIALHLGARFNF